MVKDRGSSNGTYLNNERLDEPRPLREGDLLYVGPYLLELVSIAPDAARRSGSSSPFGPVIRMTGVVDERSRLQQRLLRWATEWDAQARPRRLLLRGDALQRAVACMRPSPPAPLANSAVFTAFLAESRRRATRSTLARTFAVIGALALVATTIGATMGFGETHVAAESESSEEPVPEPAISDASTATKRVDTVEERWIDHEVIPAETLDDIARRYDVPAASIARWNGLNPDAESIEVGRKLRIKPRLDPLPQQQIVVELDKDYDWRTLSERFDVPVQKLRAYNPELGTELPAGTRVDVWIDPKPHDRSKALSIPEFDIRPDAHSVGNPNDGRLEDGIQMPKSDLYVMRAPNIMWGSSHTIENLLTAIARFRQEIDFEGVLVVADISRRGGGKIPPHKSHQAGRDVDVWMPTLKGVYQKSWLGRDRKPMRNEIDWFATWVLVRSLIETGQVAHIFLEYELQEKVYRAAKLSGATDEELATAMQWPRGPHASGILGHSSGHVAHIHVRFKCGPLDTQCVDGIRRTTEDDHADPIE
jgi:LysM repeat protein/pSer/pThr/pTyr-binding forkhead associated (FHA) protein